MVDCNFSLNIIMKPLGSSQESCSNTLSYLLLSVLIDLTFPISELSCITNLISQFFSCNSFNNRAQLINAS